MRKYLARTLHMEVDVPAGILERQCIRRVIEHNFRLARTAVVGKKLDSLLRPLEYRVTLALGQLCRQVIHLVKKINPCRWLCDLQLGPSGASPNPAQLAIEELISMPTLCCPERPCRSGRYFATSAAIFHHDLKKPASGAAAAIDDLHEPQCPQTMHKQLRDVAPYLSLSLSLYP